MANPVSVYARASRSPVLTCHVRCHESDQSACAMPGTDVAYVILPDFRAAVCGVPVGHQHH
eukprot:1989664-Rhodomonas_salina.5